MINTHDGQPFNCVCGERTRTMHKACRERLLGDDLYLIRGNRL